MIIVEGWIRLGPGQIDALRGAAATMMRATQAEPGCLHYAFSQDLAEPDLLRLSERWENDEAIAAHMKTPHMAEFNKAVMGAQILGISVKSYTAEFQRTMMGE